MRAQEAWPRVLGAERRPARGSCGQATLLHGDPRASKPKTQCGLCTLLGRVPRARCRGLGAGEQPCVGERGPGTPAGPHAHAGHRTLSKTQHRHVLAAWTRSKGTKWPSRSSKECRGVPWLPQDRAGGHLPSTPQPGTQPPSHPPFGGAAGAHRGKGPWAAGLPQSREHSSLHIPHRRGLQPPARACGGGASGPCDGTRCGGSGLPGVHGGGSGGVDGGAEARVPRPQWGERARACGCGGAWLLSERLQGDLGEIRSRWRRPRGGGPQEAHKIGAALRGQAADTSRRGWGWGAVRPAEVGIQGSPLAVGEQSKQQDHAG